MATATPISAVSTLDPSQLAALLAGLSPEMLAKALGTVQTIAAEDATQKRTKAEAVQVEAHALYVSEIPHHMWQRIVSSLKELDPTHPATVTIRVMSAKTSGGPAYKQHSKPEQELVKAYAEHEQLTYSGALTRFKSSGAATVTEWSKLWAPSTMHSVLSKINKTSFTPSEALTPTQKLLQQFSPRFEVKEFTMDELDAATLDRHKRNPKLIGQDVKIDVKASAVRYATVRHLFSNYDKLLNEYRMQDAGRDPQPNGPAYTAFKEAFNHFIARECFSI